MKLEDGLVLARKLLDAHGLRRWRVRLDAARRRCGSCRFDAREITLSKHFVALNADSEVEATVLHEIAHALAGPGAAHGPRWREVAARIGAPLGATNASAHMPAPAWLLRCIRCRRVVARRHRRVLDLARTRCSSCGIEHGRLEWLRAPQNSPST